MDLPLGQLGQRAAGAEVQKLDVARGIGRRQQRFEIVSGVRRHAVSLVVFPRSGENWLQFSLTVAAAAVPQDLRELTLE
jgi:hypothetical protein